MVKFIFLKKSLIIFLALIFVLPSNAQKQNEKKIKANYDSKPLSLVLLDLEISYGLVFDFDDAFLKDKKITCFTRKLPVGEVMKQILDGTGLDFLESKEGTIKIFPIKEEIMLPSSFVATQFDFTISGRILDSRTGESLPFANLLIKETGAGTATNVDGFFSLFNVPSDTSTVEVRYVGYQTTIFQLRPGMDFFNLGITMEDFSQQLDEVVVKAKKQEQLLQASTGVSRIGLAPAQLATLPSFGEKDIFRSLQLLPGISGTNESSSGLYVRGGTPDQNLILFDGFTVYHVDHLFGFFSAFNTHAIKDVQLYKGGFDAKYGGRLSSVVELTGKDGNSEFFNIGGGTKFNECKWLFGSSFRQWQRIISVCRKKVIPE